MSDYEQSPATIDIDMDAQDMRSDAEFPWTLFLVDGVAYGLSSRHVLSIEILDKVTPIVGDPVYIRGITRFREDMIPLVDLRALFGKSNRLEELEIMIGARIQDHINYICKLEECVQTMSLFPLTTDPHACAFGKWYYHFETKNNALSALLKRIEMPHSQIHLSAQEVNSCIARGDQAGAQVGLDMIKNGPFRETVALLEQVASAYLAGNREMVVVLDAGGRAKGIIVDEIISVEFLERMVESHGAHEHSRYIEQIAKRQKSDENVLLLNVEELAL